MGCVSKLWDTVIGVTSENKISYQADDIVFEVAVEYNLYKGKSDIVYHRKIRKVIRNDVANR